MNGHSTVQELTELIASLRRKQADLKARLTEIDQQIGNIEATLRLYREYRSISAPVKVAPETSIHEKTLTQKRKDALCELADKNNGILIGKQTGAPLVEAGLFQSIGHWRRQLYWLIGSMECLEQMQKGVYKHTRHDGLNQPIPLPLASQ